jgi:hypothetical protein
MTAEGGEHQPERDDTTDPDEAIDREDLDDDCDPVDLNDCEDWVWEP